MLLQAVPVLHFFTERPEIFYTAIDEERPTEKSKEIKEDKQDDKAFLSFYAAASNELIAATHLQNYTAQLPSSPHLELLARPPDFC